MQRSVAGKFSLWSAGLACLCCLPSSASAAVYNRTAAVAYANQYWNQCVTDGYFWINGSTYKYYGAGAPVPVNVPGEASGIGDDCAHFVSSCIGTPAGGLSIPTRVPPTYGEPGAARLDQLLISNGYAQQVTSVSQLTPGDVIGYDWTGSGNGSMSGIDHTVIYLGNNKIASHATSHDGVAWNWANSSSTITFLIHITLHDAIVPNVPTNASPAVNSIISDMTPTLMGDAFSDGAIGSTHIASQWQIYKGRALVYDSGEDKTHLLRLTVPAGLLAAGNAYTWKVRYEDNYGDWSNYSSVTSFSTASIPEPSCLLLVWGGVLFTARSTRIRARRAERREF
jgi:cell wall-associated NlpC family hydrolase